jgi:hypothetical protein
MLPSAHKQFRFCQSSRDAREAKKGAGSADDFFKSFIANSDGVIAPARFGGDKQAKHSDGASSSGLRSMSTNLVAPPKGLDKYFMRCHPIREMGLVLPPPRLVQPTELSRRQTEILRLPDVDEDVLEIPRSIGKLIKFRI